MRNTIFWSGSIGVALFVISAIFGGLLLDGYSHIHQFISESYAIGTPFGRFLRLGGYIPSGILIAIFAFLSPSILPRSKLTKISFYGVAIFYGLGTIITSIFPCDAGCNPELIDPSISQIIHNFSGFLAYAIVPSCLIIIGIKAKYWPNGKNISRITLLAGLLAFCFVGVLFANPAGPYIGFYQRIVEGSVLFWIINCAVYIKRMQNL